MENTFAVYGGTEEGLEMIDTIYRGFPLSRIYVVMILIVDFMITLLYDVPVNRKSNFNRPNWPIKSKRDIRRCSATAFEQRFYLKNRERNAYRTRVRNKQ